MNIDELQAGPETDQLIAEEVMEYKDFRWGDPDDLFVASSGEAFDYACNGDTLTCFAHSEIGFCFTMPRYSDDWGAAGLVFDKMVASNYTARIHARKNNPIDYIGVFFDAPDTPVGTSANYAHAETAPLAICRAALKAVSDE